MIEKRAIDRALVERAKKECVGKLANVNAIILPSGVITMNSVVK